jgi:aminopeptidase-like protein
MADMEPHCDMSPSGLAMYDLIRELYPICRSITGEGVRATLRALQSRIPLVIHEVPSGTRVFDWSVPLEWNIADAYIKNRRGERIVDFQASNLHVMSYSTPVRATMGIEDLRPHLFTCPDHPEWIPYRTSYYKENWGFCLSQKQLSQLADEEYEVCIDSQLSPGTLTYGECYLAGQTSQEILVSCHVCHPSLCNDNLSGIAVATFLAETLSRRTRRYSYRLVFIPGTIGSITWLARNEQSVSRIQHGLVLTGVGAGERVTYKRSRQGRADIDRAMEHVLRHSRELYTVVDFFPYGYDERQYCSPGFDLPVGCLMRAPHGEYPEYHTSADNLDFVKPDGLARSYSYCLAAFDLLEQNRTYVNLNPKCEPQLGRRGLYRAIAGQQEKQSRELVILWVLNLSDGCHSLLDIAERAGVPFEDVRGAAEALVACGLLKERDEAGGSSKPCKLESDTR